MNGLIFYVVTITISSVIFVRSQKVDSRIVNGIPSDHLEYVSRIISQKLDVNVFYKRGTGTVISQSYVLTAANMIHGYESWGVYWGTNDLYNAYYSSGYDVIAHPDFNPETLENDIGIMRIRNETLEDVGLPPPMANVPSVNVQGDVRSFGYISAAPFRSSNLVHISLPSVIEKDTCKDLLGIRGDLVRDSHFCAMDTVQNSSMCLQDEGAGFIVDIDGTKTVVGVLSFYTNMCNPNFPAAYTRVSPYVDWIWSVINSE